MGEGLHIQLTASLGAGVTASPPGPSSPGPSTCCQLRGLPGGAPSSVRLGLLTSRFMEFEAEEEMRIQKLQWVKVAQGLPPSAPPKPELRGPPAPGTAPQPGTDPHSHGSCGHSRVWGSRCPPGLSSPSRGRGHREPGVSAPCVRTGPNLENFSCPPSRRGPSSKSAWDVGCVGRPSEHWGGHTHSPYGSQMLLPPVPRPTGAVVSGGPAPTTYL